MPRPSKLRRGRTAHHESGSPGFDLVLRRAWGGTAKELAAAAETWRPWRAYAAMLLWQSGGLRAA